MNMSLLFLVVLVLISIAILRPGRHRPVEYRVMMLEPVEPEGSGCARLLLLFFVMLLVLALAT